MRKRLISQTVRALLQGKVKRTDSYMKVRRVVDRSECGSPLEASIKVPRDLKLTSLASRKGGRGKGMFATVSCSQDCQATVKARLWGRYQVGLKFRKVRQKIDRLLSSQKIRLEGGKAKRVRLDGSISKRLRKLLVRAAKHQRYDRIKFKYSIEAHLPDGQSDQASGTSRVWLK